MAFSSVISAAGQALETYVNCPFRIYLANGCLHLVLGVERPASQAGPSEPLKTEREITHRLVMPPEVARRIAEGILESVQHAGPSPGQMTN